MCRAVVQDHDVEAGVMEALEALPKVMDRLGEQKEDGTFTDLADTHGRKDCP